MKILIVLPSVGRSAAGVSMSARLLALAATNCDTQVEVFAFAGAGAAEEAKAWEPCRVRLFRSFGPRRFGCSPGMVWALMRARADVIHVHGVWMFHCLAVHLAVLAKGTPYVVTPHGMLEAWIRNRSRTMKAAISTLYQAAFLRRARALHLLTEKEREDVRNDDVRAVTVIPNYVELPPSVSEKPSWWEAGFDDADIYLFFGRVHDKKGCLELLEAWDARCTADPAFAARSVLIYGGWIDDLPSFPPRVAAVNERHGNVRMIGSQYGDDKLRTFAIADFFLLPSKSEGLPMAVLEAWAAGLPTLMTAACNLPDGFVAGAAIETAPTPEAIEEGLAELGCLSTEERARMRAAALDLVKLRYNRDVVAARLKELYGDVRG